MYKQFFTCIDDEEEVCSKFGINNCFKFGVNYVNLFNRDNKICNNYYDSLKNLPKTLFTDKVEIEYSLRYDHRWIGNDKPTCFLCDLELDGGDNYIGSEYETTFFYYGRYLKLKNHENLTICQKCYDQLE